jgi:hypothetical protein
MLAQDSLEAIVAPKIETPTIVARKIAGQFANDVVHECARDDASPHRASVTSLARFVCVC